MPFGSHRVLLLALACVAISAACSGDDDGSSARELAPVAAPAPASLSVEMALPPPGAVQAWLEVDRLVSALANQAPRGAIVAALAEAAGFELVLGVGAELEQPLTLRAEKEPLEIVLARVLGGISHVMAYENGPPSGTQRLARLTLGMVDAEAEVAIGDDRAGRRRERRRPEFTPEEREARAERGRQLHAESLAKLGSFDAGVRADAASWLDVNSSDGFQAATEHLAKDEAPEVRAAAAEVLKESDVAAVQPLLQALDDPDSRVVLAALEALEFVGDASTVPQIAPLLKHRDPEVRERTVEAIEFLQ